MSRVKWQRINMCHIRERRKNFQLQASIFLFLYGYGDSAIEIIESEAKRLQQWVISRMGFRNLIEAITPIYPHCINMQHFASSGNFFFLPFFFFQICTLEKKSGEFNSFQETPGPPRRKRFIMWFQGLSLQPVARRFHQTTSNISRVSLRGADECLHGADIRKRVSSPLNRFDTYPISVASPLHMFAWKCQAASRPSHLCIGRHQMRGCQV